MEINRKILSRIVNLRINTEERMKKEIEFQQIPTQRKRLSLKEGKTKINYRIIEM